MADEQIESLNKIIAMVDEKAAKFKNERFDMPAARREPEKKLILDLIDDAKGVANQVIPKPHDLLADLRALESELSRM